MRLPKTAAEWQEAVDLAAGMRTIADCKMYGLIDSDLEINTDRCDQILMRGRRRNITPSRSNAELAIELIAAINANQATPLTLAEPNAE